MLDGRFAGAAWFLLLAFSWLEICDLVFNAVAGHLLGPHRFGELTPVLDVMSLASAPLAIIGLASAGATEGSDGSAPYRFLGRIAPGALVLSGVWAGASPVVEKWLHVGSARPLALVSVWWISAALASVYIGVLIGQARYGAAVACLVAGAVVCQLIAVLLIYDGLGISGAVLGATVGALASLSLASVLTNELARSGDVRLAQRPTQMGRHIDPSRVVVAIGVLVLALVPEFLSAIRYRAPEGAVFDGAQTVGTTVLLVILVLGTSTLWRRGRRGRSAVSFAWTAACVASSALATTAVLGLTSRSLVRFLLGGGYASSANLVARSGAAESALLLVALLTVALAQSRSKWAYSPWIAVMVAIGLFVISGGSLRSLADQTVLVEWSCALVMASALSLRAWPSPIGWPGFDSILSPPRQTMRVLGSATRRWVRQPSFRSQIVVGIGGIATLLVPLLAATRGARANSIAELIVLLLLAAILLGFIDVFLRRSGPIQVATPAQVISHPDRSQSTRDVWIWGGVVTTLAVAAVATQFLGGGVIAGGDSPPPIGLAWIGHLFAPVGGQPDQLPWAAVDDLVNHLGGSPVVAQATWIGLLYIGAAIGTFVLLRLLRVSAPASAVGSLAYVFNLYVVSEVGNNEVFLAALTMAPLISAIVLAVGIGRCSTRMGLFLLVLSSPFLGYVSANPPLVLLIFGCALGGAAVALLIGGSSARKRCLILTVTAVPLTLAACAYWWIPGIIQSDYVSSGSLGSVSSWGWTEGRATLQNDFWLNSSWAWAYPAYFPEEASYATFPLVLLKFVLPLIAFAALPLTFWRRRNSQFEKIALFSASVAVLLIVFTTGTRWPGNLIFDPVYHLPYGYLLREPGRYLMGTALAYAVLVGLGIDRIRAGRIRPSTPISMTTRRGLISSHRVQSVLAGMVAVAILVPAYPAMLGRLAQKHPAPPLHVPSYWPAMAAEINHLTTPGAVLLEPADDFYQMPYDWGYYGTDSFITQLIGRQVIDPVAEGYVASSNQTLITTSKITADLAAGVWSAANPLLGALDARYVLVRGDVNYRYPGRHLDSPVSVEASLSHDPEAHLIRQIGPLELYELSLPEQGRVYRDASPTPNLTVLSVLEPGATLVSGSLRAGEAGVVELPSFSQWTVVGRRLQVSVPLPEGFHYAGALVGRWQGSAVDQTDASRLGRFSISLKNGSAEVTFVASNPTDLGLLGTTSPVLVAQPLVAVAVNSVLVYSPTAEGSGWIGPAGVVSTQVDGLYDGWFGPRGTSVSSVHYRWNGTVQFANWLSIAAALLVLLIVGSIYRVRLFRRVRGRPRTRTSV